VDLIILALIASFIIYRLYATLGEKTGYKEEKKGSPSNVVDFNEKQQAKPPQPTAETEEIDPAIRPAIQEITKTDPEFSLKGFVDGATIAFEMVLDAYSAGDLELLKNLLSPDVYKAFKTAITDRNDKGHTLENTLIRVEDVVIERAVIKNKIAQISVRYTTEQVPIIKDQDGEIIEGNPNQIDQVVDTWTFERSLKSSDPNWILVSTNA
jgi:predicted lipid-binding transport protein (Tim44 family)